VKGVPPRGCVHAAHGEIRFADEGQDGTSHFGDLEKLQYCFADFDARAI